MQRQRARVIAAATFLFIVLFNQNCSTRNFETLDGTGSSSIELASRVKTPASTPSPTPTGNPPVNPPPVNPAPSPSPTSIVIPSGNTTVCGTSVVNVSTVDARPTIEQCILDAPSGSTVAFMPGRYTFKTPMVLNSIRGNITLTTQGLNYDGTQKACLLPGSTMNCAIFMADETFGNQTGLIRVATANGLRIIGIAFDGNGQRRRDLVNKNTFTRVTPPANLDIPYCSDCHFYGIASVNAIWGSAFRVDKGASVTVDNSNFSYNGGTYTAEDHRAGRPPLFPADGITTGALISNLTIKNSEFHDNTDVHLIIGASQGALLQNNKLTNTNNFVYAAIYLANWTPKTEEQNNFTNTRVTGNSIDCGAAALCGMGLSVGEVNWSPADMAITDVTKVYGAVLDGNIIKNARQGIEVSGARNITLSHNSLINCGGYISRDAQIRTSNINVNQATTSNISVVGNSPNAITSGAGYMNRSFNTFGAPNYLIDMIPESIYNTLPKNILASGSALLPGQKIISANGAYNLTHQVDGNVVMYGPAGVVWQTNTVGRSTREFVMQPDGNLVLYETNGTPAFNTGTSGSPGSRLVIQDDGNLVIYNSSGGLVWSIFR